MPGLVGRLPNCCAQRPASGNKPGNDTCPGEHDLKQCRICPKAAWLCPNAAGLSFSKRQVRTRAEGQSDPLRHSHTKSHIVLVGFASFQAMPAETPCFNTMSRLSTSRTGLSDSICHSQTNILMFARDLPGLMDRLPNAMLTRPASSKMPNNATCPGLHESTEYRICSKAARLSFSKRQVRSRAGRQSDPLHSRTKFASCL